MESYKHKIDSAFKILELYDWIVNSYVLDVYVYDLLSKFPPCWKETLRDISMEELGGFMAGDKLNRVWALSTLALRASLRTVNLSRQPENACTNTTNSSINNESEEYSFLTHPRLKNLFCKHVKQKKRHEIMKMAQKCYETASKVKCEYIIDIGSGVGHLARVLAYGYNLKVCCLEAQSQLIEQARKLDAEMELTASKHLTKEFMDSINGSPKYLNMILNNDIDSHGLIQNIRSIFGISNEKSVKFGLIGLHPCGDLVPMILRIFSSCEDIHFVQVVGCCYMKLTTADECPFEHTYGYPLSTFVKNVPHNLSYTAREVACHAIETYCERLKKGVYSDLQVHSYRAALEQLIVNRWPHLKHSGMRSIKHTKELSFKRYCEVATSRLGVIIPDEDIDCENTLKNLAQWQNVVKFYSVRLLLAPLIETVILLDRLIYLTELGTICDIIPVFDPILSPRNQILTAIKQLQVSDTNT